MIPKINNCKCGGKGWGSITTDPLTVQISCEYFWNPKKSHERCKRPHIDIDLYEPSFINTITIIFTAIEKWNELNPSEEIK